MMQSVYEQEKIAMEWRDSLIEPIYKEDRDIHDCGDFLGIKLIYFEDLGKVY